MERNETDGINTEVTFSWIRAVSGTFLLFMFIVSLTSNCVLIHVLRRKNMLFRKGNRFVVGLLAVEVCVRVFGSPFVFLSVLAGRWLFGEFGCVCYAFLMTWWGITTISILSVISIERYLVVIPQHKIFISKKAAIMIMGACLLYGLFWAISPFLGWTEYIYEPSRLSCTPSWAPKYKTFVIFLLLTAMVIPLMCMVVCYGCIMWKVKTTIATQQNSQISDAQLSKTMILIMASFLFCWMPYSIIAGLGTLGVDMSHIPPEMTLIPLTCAKSSGLWNVIIYGLRNATFRKACREFFTRHNRILTDNNTCMWVPRRRSVKLVRSGSNCHQPFYVGDVTIAGVKCSVHTQTQQHIESIESSELCLEPRTEHKHGLVTSVKKSNGVSSQTKTVLFNPRPISVEYTSI